MKIALFSDIHANLPALEAVLKDMETQQPDAVYCLGDLVGYNLWPNEVIHEIRKRGIPTIAGNYDFGVGRNSDDCGCAYKTEHDKAMGTISIALSNQLINPEERVYLKTLPAHIRLEFQISNEKLTVLLVHGSPRKINEYLFEDRDEKSMVRIMRDSNSHIMCFGHTHKPYHRQFEIEEEGKGKFYLHAVNIGSVGKPKDGNPDACYCIITLSEGILLSNPESVKVEFFRVPYDVERAANAVEDSILPNEYADMLRKAY